VSSLKEVIMRFALALLFAPVPLFAQSPIPTEFPSDASTIAGEALGSRVAGKVFTVKPADGSSWRLEYTSDGYAFIDTSGGFRDTGKWRVEGNTLCIDWRKTTGGCAEARMKGEALYIKRTNNGEVVELIPR
jgi:hypothetical protein